MGFGSVHFSVLKGTKKYSVIAWLLVRMLICPVTCEKSSQLPHKELNTIIITLFDGFDTMGGNGVNRTENTSNLVVDYIRNEVKYLARQLNLLSQIASKDEATLQILKAGYENHLTQLPALIANLKVSSNWEVSSIADYLDNMLIESQKNSSNSITDLKAEKERILKLCLSKIDSEEFSSAMSEFQKLRVDSLPDLIKRAYDHNMDNVPKVLKFIKQFDCQQQEVATGLLLGLVKRDGNLKRPELLYFYGVNEKCENVSLINELEGFEAEIIESTLYKYKSDLLPCAIKFSEHPPAGEVSAKMVIFTLLYKLMETNEALSKTKLTQLSYKIWMLDRHCVSHPEECKQIKPKLNSLKAGLPSGMRALFWDKFFYIESRKHVGYRLTAVKNEVYIYPTNYTESQRWTATPVQEGRYFVFKTLSGKVLYPATGKGISRWVYIDNKYTGEEHLWQVVPYQHGQLFYLKSKVYGDAIDSGELRDCVLSSGKCNHIYAHKVILNHDYQVWSIIGQSP